MKLRILAACLLVCFAASARAQKPVEVVTGKATAMLSIGFGTMRLSEFNDFIEDRERLFQTYGVPLEWDAINTGFEVGGALAYRATDYFGFGVEGNYQFKNTDARFSDITGKLINVMHMRFLELGGFVDFWLPQAPHYHMGVHVGVGYGTFRDDVEFTDNTTPANSFTVDETYEGDGITSGVFLGYRKPYGRGAQFMARIGFRMRDIGEMKSDGQPHRDLLGDPIDFDFSGFYARLGFGLNIF